MNNNNNKNNLNSTISNHFYNKNVSYTLYMPSNLNSNTPIFIYIQNNNTINLESSSVINSKYTDYTTFISKESKSIVIILTINNDENYEKAALEIINLVRKKYNITNPNISCGSFSRQGEKSLDIIYENISQNSNLDPQVIFLIDDYSNTYYKPEYKLTSKMSEAFKKNNTIFFVFDPYWKNTDNYKTYLDKDLNIIRVEPKDYGHNEININFFKNKIYDYLAGESLPIKDYIYKKYNKESNEWEIINHNKIATINKLYFYYDSLILIDNIKKISKEETFQSNEQNKILEYYLNNILQCIKNSKFLEASFSDFNGFSTTQVPSEIPLITQRHFIQVSKNLEELTTLIKSAQNITMQQNKLKEDFSNNDNNI